MNKILMSPKLLKQARSLGDGDPIYVFIYDGRWEAASPRNPPLWRDRKLVELLHAMGGVSETKEGAWFFNVEQKKFTAHITLVETDPPVPA